MGKFIDLSGERFSRLTVIKRAENRGKQTAWQCMCECGNSSVVIASQLTRNKTKSCGCIQREYAKNRNLLHGDADTRLYNIWQGMKTRCYNPNRKAFNAYGGRGIKVCDEWLNSYTIFKLWALDNGYTDELTIERRDNDKGYSSDNCRWIPLKEQQENKRRLVRCKSGYLGVTWNNTSKRWQARIGVNGKTLNLGFYKTAKEANDVRLKAEDFYGTYK